MTLTGVTVPAGVTVQATAATGTIRDDDELSAAVSRAAASVAEGQWVEFPVTVSGGTSTADVVVFYAVGGTATSGTDYTAPSGKLTIATPATSGTISIETLDDGVLDRGETLQVSLTGASTGTRTVTVDDTASVETEITDSGTVTVSVDDAEGDEGAAVSFEVELTGAVGSVVEVEYETSNGSGEGDAGASDYTAASGTLTFRPGEALTQTVSVDTTEDTLDEPDEEFTVTLTGVTVLAGVTVQATAATGTIRDDDELSAAVSREAASVAEGQWVEFPVTVSDGTSTADVVVAYTVGGSASEGTDYTKPSGELTIATPATSGTISIETLDDGVLDRGETLQVSLTGASTGTRTVTVDDTASVETEITDSGTVTVSVDDAEGDEGAAVSFEVELTGAVGSVVEVEYETSNGSGEGDAGASDYTAASGTLTFRPGEALMQTFTVDTTEDTLDEPDEEFTVTLTGVTVPAGVTVQTTAATGTIRDDDELSAAVSRAAASVAEGQWVEFPVTVSDGTSTADVVVAYTVGGSASEGTDYTKPSGELTIATPATSGTISIETLDDGVLDRGETLQVSLTGASTGTRTVTVDDTASVETEITDSGTVTVSVDDAEADEGAAVSFEVELTGAVGSVVEVEYETSNGSGEGDAGASDYTAASGTLTFRPGEALTQTVHGGHDRGHAGRAG